MGFPRKRRATHGVQRAQAKGQLEATEWQAWGGGEKINTYIYIYMLIDLFIYIFDIAIDSLISISSYLQIAIYSYHYLKATCTASDATGAIFLVSICFIMLFHVVKRYDMFVYMAVSLAVARKKRYQHGTLVSGNLRFTLLFDFEPHPSPQSSN